jgi:hypothetical protein
MAAGCLNCRRFLDEVAALCSTTRRSDLTYEMADPVLSKWCVSKSSNPQLSHAAAKNALRQLISAEALLRRDGDRILNAAWVLGVAKLADAPDLGFRNHRFQNVSFCFKKTNDLRGENAIFRD